tara:strand:+ start:2468 stop:2692 length:225 start_codon:yes stop_codon:yes gene_type:complete
MTKKEKGRKWDGRSRISTDQYKRNWNDIFGNKNVVRTEASFVSRDYSNENTDNIINDNDGTRTDKVSDKEKSDV